MAEEQAEVQGDTSTAGDVNEATQAEATQTDVAEKQAPVAEKSEEQAPASEATEDKGLLGETKPESAPETYSDFTLGESAEVSAEDQEALKSLAKEHSLTQEQAEKAVGFSRSIVEQIAKEEQAAVEQFRADNKKAWESQPDHAERTLFAQKAVKNLGKDMEDYLTSSSQLHDAKILTILSELGKHMSEPSHVAGTETAPAGPSRIYDKSPDMYS